MKFQIKKCHTCKALGVGPRAVKLYPMDDLLYCKDHWREQSIWDENRKTVARWAESESDTAVVLEKINKARTRGVPHPGYKPPKLIKKDWRGYIKDLTDLAGWGLEVGDKRTFTHYAALAVLAWGLREAQEENLK